MKTLSKILLLLTILLSYPFELLNAQTSNEDLWVSAYIASWNYNVGGHGNWGNTQRDEVDWSTFTHGVFFAQGISGSTCQPRVPAAWENVSPDRINAFVEDANANNVPAIMSFGGAGNTAFMDCIEDQPNTVANGIADFVEQWGFDGADIDAEPARDHPNYDVFITTLRNRLPNAILTAAVNGDASLFARVHDKFDQINIMTYDLSGAWGGWYSWHNAAIYNPSGGSEVVNIPGSNTEYPNVEQKVTQFNEAGVPLEKLGFGIDLYGYVWTGVNAPEQDADNATRRFGETSYDQLVEEFPGIATNPQWDEQAQAAWYGTGNQFVSFDNERTITAKFDYARNKGVGGMIVWEYTGSPNTLMPAVGEELGNEDTGQEPEDPAPLDAPTLVFPDDLAEDLSISLELKWTEVSEADEYEIQIALSESFSNPLIIETGITNLSHSFGNLDYESSYYWRVRAENSSGNGEWSSVFTFKTTTDDSDVTPPNTGDDEDLWVSAYVASWNYNVGGHGNWGNTRREEIDWSTFTHGIFFAQGISGSTCQPRVPAAWENISPDRINAFVEDANANNVPAIMSFGGAGNSAFADCIETQPETVANGIADFIEQWNFDGADIDPEPVPDSQNFVTFMQRLRERLPDAIITGASMSGSSAAASFAAAESYFDQINIMTYDLSGAWGGWYSWHNAPIFNPSGGSERINIPGSNTEYPNIEQLLNRFNQAGIPMEKLGFGIDLYGYVWTGINAPEQDADNATRRYGETSYDRLVEEFPGIATDPQWDENAQAAWFGTSNEFISFDNKRTIAAKFDYARNKGVGGMIVWEYTGSSNTLMPVVGEELGNKETEQEQPASLTAPELVFPDDLAEDLSIPLELKWTEVSEANEYEVQISTSPNFEELLVSESGLNSISINIDNLEGGGNYYWRARAVNENNFGDWSTIHRFSLSATPTSNEEAEARPTEFALKQNYPNPFNPTTNISFSLPKTSKVSLKIYNLLGSEVATLVNERMPAGNFEVQWNAAEYSSGVYIYRIVAGDFVQTKKLTLIK